MNPTPDSPLALRFEEALQPSVFLTQLRTSAENQAKRELASLGNDALKCALAGAKFVLDSTGMQVVFENGIPKGARLMRDVAGKALPKLVDGKTGRILKTARVVSPTRVAASATGGAALVIVEAAHIISDYDNAQRLKKVEGAVDALLHAHQSELKSRLKAIYGHCKELINGDLNQLSEHDQRALHGQCLVLMELRARWQNDFEHRLGKIEKAKLGVINQILWWRRDEAFRKDREAKAKDAIEALEIVQLMHFSLMLQMVLAGASGHMEAFKAHTLRDECQSWRELMEFTSKRAGEICGYKYRDPEEFMPFLNAMSDLVKFWSPERWEEARNQEHLGIFPRNLPPGPIQGEPSTSAPHSPPPPPPPSSHDEKAAIPLEYHDMEWFERREQELSQHKCTNRDAATDDAECYHRLHQDDATHESGIDPDGVTDCEREQLRYNGGADSQYWNAE